jgi:hypothetical protein
MRDDITPGLTLPKGGAARLFSLPDIRAFEWCLVVAADPARARGGAVALAFATMADALACKRRLEGGAA